jgi:hypothetical protein
MRRGQLRPQWRVRSVRPMYTEQWNYKGRVAIELAAYASSRTPPYPLEEESARVVRVCASATQDDSTFILLLLAACCVSS